MFEVMMLVDSHCHLDLLTLKENESLDDVISQALANNVKHLLSVSVSFTRFQNILEQAKNYSNVSISCGLHPNEDPGFIPSVEELSNMAKEELVVAIGETGLDTYRSSEEDLIWQEKRFINHIKCAKQLHKPLIIHTRDTKEKTLSILSSENADAIGGVLHCFTEDLDMAERAIEMGFYISFSGIITFKNAKNLQEVAKKVPLERILVETDSPYLSPVPYRGKPNYPANVLHVAQFIADLREISLELLAQKTTDNFFNLFSHAKRNCA